MFKYFIIILTLIIQNNVAQEITEGNLLPSEKLIAIDIPIDDISLTLQKTKVSDSINYRTTHPSECEDLNDILSKLQNTMIEQNGKPVNTQSVHIHDSIVVEKLPSLLRIVKTLDFGKTLTHPEALSTAHKVNKMQSSEMDSVDEITYFNVNTNYLNELCLNFFPNDFELFSRAVTLSYDLKINDNKDIGIYWFQTIEDNITTNGGCYQGRRNRLFIALAYMAAYQTKCST